MAFTEMDFWGINYLLVIGINKYQHESELNNAVRDAQNIKDVLLEYYEGFEPEFVRELYDEQATEENIFKELRWLIKNTTEEDNVIIYYSGHGILDKDFDEGFWITYESKRGDRSSCVPNIILLQAIRRIKARHIALISDSCFSGSLFATNKSAEETETVAAERKSTLPSRWGFSSGMEEVVTDGRPGENSPFALSIINYLKTNTIARIPFSELINHVTNVTAANAAQTPIGKRLQYVGDQSGEFMLEVKTDEETFWEITQTKDTVVAYNTFLIRFPDSSHKEEIWGLRLKAQKREAENESWGLARTENTIEAYQRYLSVYAETGEYAKKAKSSIQQLQETAQQAEELAWTTLKEAYDKKPTSDLENLIILSESFLEKYPDGKWSKEVKSKSRTLLFTKYGTAYTEWIMGNLDELITNLSFKHQTQPPIQSLKRRKTSNKMYGQISNDRFYYILDAILEANPTLITYIDDEKYTKKKSGHRNALFNPILKSFPWTISYYLKNVLECEGHERNKYIKENYKGIFKTLCFILLSELWDKKETTPHFMIDESFSKGLECFLSLTESNYLKISYTNLFICLVYLFKANDWSFFMPKIGDLVDNKVFMAAITFLDKLNPDESEHSEAAEKSLANILSALAFFSKYEMLTTRAIRVEKSTKGEVLYQTEWCSLQVAKAAELSLDFKTELMTQLLPTNSILLRHKTNTNNLFLNLSPFVFDKNAYLSSSKQFVHLFLYMYSDKEACIYKSLEHLNGELEIESTQFQKKTFINMVKDKLKGTNNTSDYYAPLRTDFFMFRQSVGEESVMELYHKWSNAKTIPLSRRQLKAIEKNTQIPIKNYEPNELIASSLDAILAVDITQDPFEEIIETDEIQSILKNKIKMENIHFLIEDAPTVLTVLLKEIFKTSTNSLSLTRLQLLHETYRKTTQLLAFLLLGQLQNLKLKDKNLFFSQKLKAKLKEYWSLDNNTYQNFDYTLLFIDIILFLRDQKIQPIVEAIRPLFLDQVKKNDFFNAYRFFKGCKKLTQNFENKSPQKQKELHYATEYYLAKHLKSVDFLFKMNLISVRNTIAKTNRTGKKVLFEILKGNCHSSDPLIESNRITSEQFLPNKAILWVDNAEQPQRFVNLSPFCVDTNYLQEKEFITFSIIEYLEEKDIKVSQTQIVQKETTNRKGKMIQKHFKNILIPKKLDVELDIDKTPLRATPFSLKTLRYKDLTKEVVTLKNLLLS